MAAGRVKFLLIISVWFLAFSYAFELGKHCKLHVRTSKVPFAGNSITPWIKGSILCRNWLTTRRSGNYLKSRVNYYSNCSATFNLELLRLCGDISTNPGPLSTKRKCSECDRVVAQNHRATWCDGCSLWTHIKCGGVPPKEYLHMKSTNNISRTCRSCLELLHQLPFANASLNSSGISNAESISEENDTVTSVWTEFDNIARKHRGNFKIGHVNANSVGGFKLYEIKTWLLSGRFDVLVISETKIDASFPDSQFHIDGYRLCRNDRQAGGGGLMIYVRSDIYFMTVRLEGMSPEDSSTFKTEFMVLKIKLGKGWITVVGVYRPPSVPKSRWINELSTLFEAVAMLSDTVFYAGDFNAD